MSVRLLLAMLVAIAVLFAPAFSRAGEAFAAVPEHHAQMPTDGHCQSVPDDSRHDKSAERSCCIAMCMGVAVASPMQVRELRPAPAPAVFSIRPLHLSFLGEIATPPPKFA